MKISQAMIVKNEEKNIEKAKIWYKKSAEQGYQNSIDKLNTIKFK